MKTPSIKQFDPEIGKSETDKQKDEIKKLKAKVKKERKSAIREIKKDNYFLHQEKTKRTNKELEQQEAKRKQIMSMLESEQAELKKDRQLKRTKRF